MASFRSISCERTIKTGLGQIQIDSSSVRYYIVLIQTVESYFENLNGTAVMLLLYLILNYVYKGR